VLADLFTIQAAVLVIAVITAIAGAVTFFLLPETLVRHPHSEATSIPPLEPEIEPSLSETRGQE
jgi:hypothetical protein